MQTQIRLMPRSLKRKFVRAPRPLKRIPPEPHDLGSVKTINRMVSVLNCFSAECNSWSLAELSVHLALPKSTLCRFLAGLESAGILRRDPDDKRWRLGYRLFLWGSLAVESTGLHHIARPIMVELNNATGETVVLTEYHNRNVICTDIIETRHRLRVTMDMGAMRAPHAGAASKVLMAFLPDDEVDAIIREKGLPKLCINTITDPAKLKQNLAEIRARGCVASIEEADIGAWGIAAPVRNWKGEVIAGLGITGPTSRYSDVQARQYTKLCCAAAQHISSMLCPVG